MKVMGTLRSFIDNGYSIYAHHEVVGDQRCSHSGKLDLLDLEGRLGPDFDMVARRAEFMAMLVCSVCAAKDRRWRNPKGNMALVFTPPANMEDGARIVAERRAKRAALEQRRLSAGKP